MAIDSFYGGDRLMLMVVVSNSDGDRAVAVMKKVVVVSRGCNFGFSVLQRRE